MAVHKSHIPGLLGVQGLERLWIIRKAKDILVELELPVKGETVFLMGLELRQFLDFLKFLYIVPSAMCMLNMFFPFSIGGEGRCQR